MLVCPKCGQSFPDNDLRTLCPGCFTSLERRGEGTVSPPHPPTATPSPSSPTTAPVPPSAQPSTPPATPAPVRSRTPRATTPVERRIRQGDPVATGLAVVACILTIFALSLTAPVLAGKAGLGSVVFAALFWVLVVVTTRAFLFRHYVREISLILPRTAQPGEAIPYRLVIEPARDLPASTATLTLRAEERAVSMGQHESRTRRTEVFRLDTQLFRQVVLTAGHQHAFEGKLALPANAVPTFDGRWNSLKWEARLWVVIPGWRPDVHKRLPLTVSTLISGPPPPEPRTNVVPLDWADRCHAELEITAEQEHGVLRLQTGQQTHARLRLTPTRKLTCGHVWIELGYRVDGQGGSEGGVACRAELPGGEWASGETVERAFVLTVPAQGPVSYAGQCFNITWWLSLQVDIPAHADLRTTLPVIVECGRQPYAQKKQ